MKIGGLGEFEGIRQAMPKKDEPAKPRTGDGTGAGTRPAGEDEVQISETARVFAKLKQIPDVRRQEIERVLAKRNDGTLMTPEAVKESVAKMIRSLL